MKLFFIDTYLDTSSRILWTIYKKKNRMKCVVHDYINTLVPILWTIYKKNKNKNKPDDIIIFIYIIYYIHMIHMVTRYIYMIMLLINCPILTTVIQ